MAKKNASIQETKHRKFLKNYNKRPEKQRIKSLLLPRFSKSASEVSSNWKALSAELKTYKEPKKTPKFKKRPFKTKYVNDNVNDSGPRKDEIWFDGVDPDDLESVIELKKRKISADDNVHTHSHTHGEKQTNDVTEQAEIKPRITKYVGMDCEFVGVGKDGLEHMLARVSLVNIDGDVLYDKYVASQEKVIDYRTEVSGIRPFHLRNAPKFVDVQKDVAMIIKDKVLIGHSVSTDLKVLLLNHPRKRIRDTAKYKPFQQKLMTKRPSLKRLAKEILSISIQAGEHSSVEDARAAMKLYSTHRKEWEKNIKDKFRKTRTTKPS